MFNTAVGNSSHRYWGADLLQILVKCLSLDASLRDFKDSQPSSSDIASWLAPLRAPQTILAASSWKFSRRSASLPLQLSQMWQAYSNLGRINEKYMVSKDFLSISYFNFLITSAIGEIWLSNSSIYDAQLRLLVIVINKCLCFFLTFSNAVLLNTKGGIPTCSCLKDTFIALVLVALNLTSHWSAHYSIYFKSLLTTSCAILASV